MDCKYAGQEIHITLELPLHWDDIKIFLCVARRKKLSVASKELKLDETTVSRRIKRLEQNLSQILFERLRTGHKLTANGQILMSKAEDVERSISTIRADTTGQSGKPHGVLRISVAEGFGAQILAPTLHDFIKNYPDLEIDLVSGSGFLSLSKREADVSISLNKSKSKHILSHKMSPYKLHLYGSEQYLNRHAPIVKMADLSKHTLIDYVDDLIYSDELRYFYDLLPHLTPKIRCTSIMAQRKMVESGLGLAVLPDFLVPPSFKKVLPKDIEIVRHFWFSTHQTVAGMTKVKLFKQFAFERLKIQS